MARAEYRGVNGVARKVNKIYRGSTTIVGTLTNILKNGSFEYGSSELTSPTTGVCDISISTAKAKYGSKSLAVKITKVTSSNEQVMCTIDVVKNHVYYMLAYFNVEGTSIQPKTTFSPSDSWNWLCATNGVSGGSGWQRLSSYYKNTEYTSMKVRFAYYGGAVGDIMYIDGATILDLTEAFGEGHEPTKAWMDANIDFVYSYVRKSISVDSGIAREVKKAYRGVNGVARMYYRKANLIEGFWKVNDGASSGNTIVNDWYCGWEGSNLKFHVNITRSSGTNTERASCGCNCYCGDIGGKKVSVTYSMPSNPSYTDFKITFYGSETTHNSSTLLSDYGFSATNGKTATITAPSGTKFFDFWLGVGCSGTNTISVTITGLTIDSKVVI